MGLRNSYVIMCFALMLTLSSSINALDITKILGQYPEFSTFNKYLTETKLAEEINGVKAVTVLALDNAALASLSGKPIDVIKTVVGSHVIRDYYDEKRVVDAIGSHTQLVTFAQPIYVNLIGEGAVAFASAEPNAAYKTEMVRSVSNQPDIVSVLQVTQPIDVLVSAAAKSSPAVSTVAEAPNSVLTKTPEGVVAEAPKSVVSAEAPESVVSGEAPTSVVDEAAPPAPAPGPSSSSSRTEMGVFGAVVAFASLFVSL